MRTPKKLSYSSMSKFYADRDDFYLSYIADKAAPRMPQERPAAAGSAFDAYEKSAISEELFGKGARPQFDLDTVFESQVEPQNRDWAYKAGKYLLECYKLAGAHDALMTLLRESVEEPRMEFSVDGTVGGAPFTGKPDLRFILNRGSRIDCIWDFKVKGFCSKYGASPSKGYAVCNDGYKSEKPSRSQGKSHANYMDYDHHGLTINAGYMEGCSKDYADQLSIYGWLLGEVPGDENVVLGIEELVGKYMGEGNDPLIRVASHRARVTKAYQLELVEKVSACWKAITEGHIFTDLSREESDARCLMLDEMAVGLASDGSLLDDFFSECTRPAFRGKR